MNSLRNEEKMFYNIPIDYSSLNSFLVNGFIASAEVFRLLTDVLFKVLLGTPPAYKTKRTLPLHERRKGVFGVGVESYLVIEEQGRGSLHGHGLFWGAIPPSVLQKASNVSLIKKEVESALNKINRGKIPLAFHVGNMINRIHEGILPRGIHLDIPSNANVDAISFDTHVAKVVSSCNIHQHSNTCRKSSIGKVHCRLARPQASVPCTDCTEVEYDKDSGYRVKSSTSKSRNSFSAEDSLSKTIFSNNDDKLLVWEIERPYLRFCDSESLLKVLESEWSKCKDNTMRQYLKTVINNFAFLDESLQCRVLKAVAHGNEWIVEYNALLTGLLRCNSNVSLLGGSIQAKAALFYLVKYMSKPVAEVREVLPMLHRAYQHMKRNPSVADDSGSDDRTAIYFLTRVVNQMTGLVEISGQMAGLALLGVPAEISSVDFFYVFVLAAVDYVKSHCLFIENVNELNEFEVDENSASTCSQNLSTLVDDLCTDEDKDNDEHVYRDPINPDECSFEQIIRDVHSSSDEIDVDETEKSGNSILGTATVYNTKAGKVAVSQATHYAYRGVVLYDFCLYEYCSLIDVIENTSTVTNASESIRHGRKCNLVVKFAEGHPLYSSHVQRLRSKLKIPVPVDVPPTIPSMCPKTNMNLSWEKRARKCAQYYLVLFKQWTVQTSNGTLPESLSWQFFCKFLKSLQRTDVPMSERIINNAKLFWIRNMMNGLKCSDLDRMTLLKFRSRNVTIWNEKTNENTSYYGHVDTNTEDVTLQSPGETSNNESDDVEKARTAIEDIRMRTGVDDWMNAIVGKQEEYCRCTYDNLSSTYEPFVNFSLLSTDHPHELPVDLFKSSNKDRIDAASLWQTVRELQTVHSEDVCTGVCTGKSTVVKLNAKQLSILNICKTWFWKTKFKINVKPLRLFIHGGPGTGKSFLIKEIYKLADHLDLHIACMAPTGVAACSLPSGRTIHSLLRIPTERSANSKYLQHLTPEHKITLQNNLKVNKLKMLIIDEISYVDDILFSQVESRLREVMENDEAFGGISILLLGDFFQLPPVCAKHTLFSAAVKMGSNETQKDFNDVTYRCVHLFTTFRKFELVEQMRAAEDVNHTAILQSLRTTSDDCGINENAYQYIISLRTFSLADLLQDSTWFQAPIIVTSNRERYIINDMKASLWSSMYNTPKITWNVTFGDQNTVKVDDRSKRFLYDNNKSLQGIFVAGAPGFLTENVNTDIRLCNGTKVFFHSLVLHSNENLDRLNLFITNSKFDEKYHLQYPPDFIVVAVPTSNTHLPSQYSVEKEHVLIPLGMQRSYETEKLKIHPSTTFRPSLKYRVHPVQLAFASTVHKIQGQTCDKVIVDLNHRPFAPQFNFHSIYVALSRTRSANNIRLVPWRNSKSPQYIRKLHPNPYLLQWLRENNSFE